MRSTIDERIKDIALKFGSQVPKSYQYCFPKQVSLLPELMKRRGPTLLGSIVGSEDGRFVLRNWFLNASFDLSLQMVAPCCLMHWEGGTFEELPAYDLAMQSDAAVVLDHGTDVFIWLVCPLAPIIVICFIYWDGISIPFGVLFLFAFCPRGTLLHVSATEI
jgi:hypothetical protein